MLRYVCGRGEVTSCVCVYVRARSVTGLHSLLAWRRGRSAGALTLNKCSSACNISRPAVRMSAFAQSGRGYDQGRPTSNRGYSDDSVESKRDTSVGFFSHKYANTCTRKERWKEQNQQMVVGGGKEVLMVERVVLLPLATRSQRLMEETA